MSEQQIRDADEIIATALEAFLGTMEQMLPDSGDLSTAACFAYLDTMERVSASIQNVDLTNIAEADKAYANLGFLTEVLTGFAFKVAADRCCVKTMEDARSIYAEMAAGVGANISEGFEEMLKEGNH